MTTPTKKYSLARHRATTRSKALRRRGMTLSRVRRKALRRSAMRAFRCWQHLTRCFAFFHRRSRGCLSSRFRTLRRLFGSAFLALWLPAVAQAETFTVTSSSDLSDPADGQTTLREAIALANETPGPDLIDFAEELSGSVLTLTQGELAISDELAVDASDLAEAPVIDADEKSRVMHFTAAEGDLSLTKLTLRNGKIWENNGGGIRFASRGTLALTRSTVSGNSVGGNSDKHYGGGISAGGAVTITNSNVSENSADGGDYSYGGGISAGGAVTITNSNVSENSADGGDYSYGGGISAGGAVTITNSIVSGNSADGGGGDYAYGGGVYTKSGSVTITNSIVSGNSAGSGGGVYTRSGSVNITDSTVSGNSGGGITTGLRGGSHTLTNCTVSGNSAWYNGGGIFVSGAAILTNCTVSGNSTRRDGGGIFVSGSLILKNSTVSGNSTLATTYTTSVGLFGRDIATGSGGGIYVSLGGSLTVTNSTVSANSAARRGGGISAGSRPLSLTSSIIAGNSDNGPIGAPGTIGTTGTAPDLFASGSLEISHCLIGDSTGVSLDEAAVNLNNLIDVDPLLEPLADNGGPTRTHALRAGSPAIDQGNATGLDQRGFPRVDDRLIVNAAGGNGSDIGAFERPISPNAQILESWLLSHGLPADSDLTEDLNNDGVSLLMAYALALDPHANLSGSMPVPVINGDSMSLSFHAASPGITYTVETSTNLAHWTTEGVVWSEATAEGHRTASVERDNQRRFLRLLVSVTD